MIQKTLTTVQGGLQEASTALPAILASTPGEVLNVDFQHAPGATLIVVRYING